MVQCTGCYRHFSASGYSSHVTHTLNEVCRVAYCNALRHEDFDNVLSTLQQDDLFNKDGDYGTWEIDSAGLHRPIDDDFEGKFLAGGKLFHT